MCAKDCNDCEPCKKSKKEINSITNKKSFFTDSVTVDFNKKKLISIRDGVVDYYGIDSGIEPVDKVFKVYREPKDIVELAPSMVDLPITDDHINMDAYNIVGAIVDSTIEEYVDQDLLSSVAISNTARLNDDSVLQDKTDVSLGFFAKLVEADESDPFDFKQVDIRPHHLAIVEVGRCGEA